jgi:hypothetical protein
MIIQWKQESPLLYRAVWQNMHLELGWEKPVWRVYVNDNRTKQCWDSAAEAKAGVDAIVGKLLSNGPVVPVEKYGASKIEAALPRLNALTTLCALVTMDLERRTAHA